MLALTLLVTLTLQDPEPQKAWVVAGVDPSHTDAVVVAGTPELSPRAAYDAALQQAQDGVRGRCLERGTEIVRSHGPLWLPAFAAEPMLLRWVAAQSPASVVQVLDQEQRVRDHGFGRSYQTFLLVREDDRHSSAGDQRLLHDLATTGKQFLGKCAVTVLGWGVLAFLLSWFDRLSRGYMSGRLLVIGLSIAVGLPAILLLV